MAIGDVRSQIGAPRQERRMGQNMTGAAQMGEGIGRALTQLSSDVLSLHSAVAERNKQKASFDVEQRWVRWQTDQAQAYAELKRASPVDGAGFTDGADAALTTAFGDFLSTVPPALQPEYKVLGEKYRNQRVLDAFNHEITAGDAAAETGIKDTLTGLGTSLGAGQIDRESAVIQLNTVIDKSPLPPETKESLKRNGEQALITLQLGKDLQDVAAGRGTVENPQEGDVVAAGLDPVQRTILNTIAGPESGGRYDVRNGGTSGSQTITDFSDHPRIKSRTAGGTLTSAAGRYQFIEGTWDAAVAYARTQGVLITDFSPESQDRVAALWAPKRYRDLSGGRDMNADLASGDFDTIANVRRVLGGTPGGNVEWEGFQHMTDAEFVGKVSAGLGQGGTTAPGLPDVWNDPAYAKLPLEQKLQASAQAQQLVGQQAAAALDAQLAANKARQDSLFASAYQGDMTVDAIPMLWANGQITSVEDEQRVRAGITAFQEKTASSADVSLRMATGSAFTKGDTAALDTWVGESGAAAIRGMDLDETTRVMQGLAQAGIMAPVVDATFSQMLSAGSPSEKAFALEQLSLLQGANPRALAGAEVMETHGPQITMFGAISGRYASAEETLNAIEQGRQRHEGKTAAVVRSEGEELLKDVMETPEDVKGFVRDNFTSPFGGQVIISDYGQDMIYSEFRSLFQKGYALTGSAEGATAFATEGMKETWAKSPMNNGRIMKFAPEALYPSFQGGHDWLAEQLEADLDLPKGATYELIPGLQTEREYEDYRRGRTKELPSYNVLITWPNGEVSARTGWYGDPAEMEKAARAYERGQYITELYEDKANASPEEAAIIETQLEDLRNGLQDRSDTIIP